MKKNIAVILAGSGVYDGSEIYESTLTLLYLDAHGVNVSCFAPNINQHHTINHGTGDESNQIRNVLVESARIARGNVSDLEALNMNTFDAVIIPGGFGVAKNLCDFAFKGSKCSVIPVINKTVLTCQKLRKPMVFMCIAPAIAAKCIPGVKITIGNDADTATALSNMGATHINTAVDNFVFDEEKLVLSTPAYMLANSISEAASGIEKCINKLLNII